MNTNIYANLPKIVYITGMDDCGSDAGTCPHCGASGRYIYHFVTEDGQNLGAMRGCLKKFPMHPFAQMHADILMKEKDCKAKGWALPQWDAKSLEAIEKFAHNEISEWQAKDIINRANADKKAYMKRRGYR